MAQRFQGPVRHRQRAADSWGNMTRNYCRLDGVRDAQRVGGNTVSGCVCQGVSGRDQHRTGNLSKDHPRQGRSARSHLFGA